MDFCILGPLEVHDGNHRLRLGGARQRALLGLLLLHANEVVSSDRLVDQLWGDADGSKALQVAVSRLRKVIGPDVLVTRPPGYELRVEPGELDLHRFQELVAEGRAARDPAAASETLTEAVALWRGPPLADLTFEASLQTDLARLDELRLAALEDRLDADLALGRHADVTGELEALTADHPLRERLRGQLMLALYRSGRQAEALDAYADARRALVEELGIEPSRALRNLQEGILRQDPKLDRPPAAEAQPDVSRAVFVGRKRELAGLVGALEDALAGRGRLVLVSGEPGVGKSRLADEAIGEARARGAIVLTGRCWEAGGAPAYWPWVQSLRAYVPQTELEALRAQLGDGAPDLAQLLPELRELFPDLSEAPTLESEAARFRLFEAVASLLKGASKARPLVLVLDDVHAADEPSLLLLQFVARGIADNRLLVVCAFRDVDPTMRDPLSSALAELVREPHTSQIALAGLSEPDVAEYVELSTGVQAVPRQVEAIHSETEGNPLFVGEVVRLLDAEGRIAEADEQLRIPPGVRAVIGRRLGRLSERCRDLLVPASVLGREFGLDALARIGGLPREELLDALDEAIAERVLDDVPGSPGRLRFGHALIRDTLYDDLSSARRQQLHLDAGEALEEVYAADLEPHLAELALHFLDAGGAGDPAKGIDYARAAADRAARLFAYEEAARLYEMALEALGPESAATARLRCELLLSLADSQGRAGEGSDAKTTFLRAAELARSADEPELLARAAVSYGGRFVWDRAVSDERLVPLLEDALAAVGEGDSALRIRLLSRLGAALRGEPSREPRERICEEAVKAARRMGDPAALAYALDAAGAALHAPQTVERRLAEATEIVSLAGAVRDRERVYDGHEHAFWAAWEFGDPARRASELASMRRVAEELRQPSQFWTLGLARAVLAVAEGRFAEAEELIEQAAGIGARVQTWGASVARRLELFVLRRAQGRLDGFERELQEDSEFPAPLVRRSALANVYAQQERPAEAGAVVDELMRRELSEWHVDEEWLSSLCLLADTCELIGATKHAGALYSLLLPWGSLNAVAVPEVSFDSASRPLGTLATRLGRLEDAERHFEEALEMNERMGARPELAHTQVDYARMLRVRDGPGDRDRSRELLETAVAGYRELGMETWAARAEALA
jgi:DNA-binding SARP family transcriptional activator/tetratricopeptide (TPR) repeat protein